jgi:type II secretory pathway component GspD/PulD (secretin)/tetratricopeptide (TPR) repeat protein
MRLRFLFLPLLAIAPVACRSTDTTESDTTPVADTSAPEMEENAAILSSDTSVADDTGQATEASYSTSTTQDTDLRQEADAITRKMTQRSFLAQQAIDEGDGRLDRADLEGALVAFSEALEVDPSNVTARERMQKVESLLGHRYAVAADALQDDVERAMVKRAMARIEAERFAILASNAMAKGNYDLAIQNYRQAEMILRYHPLINHESLDERQITGLLNEAIDLREESRLQQEQAERDRARLVREEKERRELEYHENKLITLYEQANQAFLAENFKSTEKLCDLILMQDPGNDAATTLREISRSARHQTTAARNRRDYKEQWMRTFNELDQMNVPQVGAVVFDDLRRWAEVSKRQPLEFSAKDAEKSRENQSVFNRLEEIRFPPKFVGEDGEGAMLADVATYLQSLTGVNFVISTAVREDLGEEETMIKLELPEYSVRKILDIIGDTHESLRWRVADGVVKFVTADEMIGGQELKTYEVRDLIHPIPDFPGTDINVKPSGGIFLPEEDLEERESNVVTSDLLDMLIRNNINPESWDADPANSLVINEMGVMVVNQTPAVHEKISQLLADLREATGIMIDIQSRFIEVEDNFLEDIGVDFRGLGQPGPGTNEVFDDFGDATASAEFGNEIGTDPSLGAFYDEGEDGDIKGRVEQLYDSALGDDKGLQRDGGLSFQWTYLNDVELELVLRAVQKSERVETVSNPRILVSNTGRANLTVLNQVVYVKDFDVEIAQAASIADPIIDVVQDGVILDVRPVVSADRRFITLELRPTIAELVRPIREVSTTLGSQASVTIQLPELEIKRVRTSIPMPDGATVMLGGLKTSDKKDYRSGVPILNSIPLISMLFERKGKYVANKKLLILLKADIVIPSEFEPTPAQIGMR